jgi:hypothetical protein
MRRKENSLQALLIVIILVTIDLYFQLTAMVTVKLFSLHNEATCHENVRGNGRL